LLLEQVSESPNNLEEENKKEENKILEEFSEKNESDQKVDFNYSEVIFPQRKDCFRSRRD